MGSKKERPLRLYFVTTLDDFEADFVIAKTVAGARKIMDAMYGLDGELCPADLIMTIDGPWPAWLDGPTWLGPDPSVLSDLGGKRLPSIGSPKWQFGGRVFGSEKTYVERVAG